MTQGHCFVGVWLVEKTFSRLIESDCTELRKAIAAKELIVFETTLITHRPPARFEDAVKTAMAATRESVESEFQATIDITRARMASIRPLASHQTQNEVSEADEPAAPIPLATAPNFAKLPHEEVDAKPTTPEGRIERWQRKLLDLSLRNRLLNTKFSKQTIPLHCLDLSRLEDQLAFGSSLKLISLSDHNHVTNRDSELHRARTSEDSTTNLQSKHLRGANLRSSLATKS